MERLRTIISQYHRWQPVSIYIDRIETYLESDFSLCVENAKSLLEAIAKEICDSRGEEISGSGSINSVLRRAFSSLGYSGNALVTQVSSALATIGSQIGSLRNEIGTVSHGRNLKELEKRNSGIDDLTRDFLIDTTIVVAVFLIRNFESVTPEKPEESIPLFYENPDFNDYWDSAFGEFSMGEMSYTASEILYNLDINAYLTELKTFQEQEDDET